MGLGAKFRAVGHALKEAVLPTKDYERNLVRDEMGEIFEGMKGLLRQYEQGHRGSFMSFDTPDSITTGFQLSLTREDGSLFKTLSYQVGGLDLTRTSNGDLFFGRRVTSKLAVFVQDQQNGWIERPGHLLSEPGIMADFAENIRQMFPDEYRKRIDGILKEAHDKVHPGPIARGMAAYRRKSFFQNNGLNA